MTTITTDNPFTESERKALQILVERMIPADEELGVPAASDPAIFADVLSKLTEHHSLIAHGLQDLHAQCNDTHATSFFDLDPETQLSVAAAYGFASPFLLTLSAATTHSYYADPRVLSSLSLPPRAPFPSGHTIPDGDWQLLDEVKKREPFWRRPA